MRTIERILIILTVLLLIPKLLLENVDVLLFITLSSLTVFYFCFGFYILNNLTFKHIFNKSTYTDISTVRAINSIGASMFLSILVLGILFRLIEYKANVNFMTVGLISAAAVIIISFVNYQKRKNQFYLEIVFKFAHWGVLGLIIHAVHN